MSRCAALGTRTLKRASMRIGSGPWLGSGFNLINTMNILALEKIIENMKQTEALLFAQHRDADHPDNCKWGVAWKAQEEARKALESLKGEPTKPADYYVPPSRIISLPNAAVRHDPHQ